MRIFNFKPIFNLNTNIFYIIITLGTLLAMLQNPAAALLAAQNALDSWWNKVVPALTPFFIISEICSRIGLIRACGVWLTPIMQPLFRLPGAAAVGLLLGFFSGSPTGAAATANLRAQGLITCNEGERMVAFCNNTGPMYLLITVSALLGDPAVGVMLAAVQYPVNLAFGLLLRFCAHPVDYRNYRRETAPTSPIALWLAGWRELTQAPTLPLGTLLRESALKALTNIGMIGAFMLVFSLLLTALKHFGAHLLLMGLLSPLLALLDLPPAVLPALTDGLFEMTLGIQTLATADIPLFSKAMAAAVILGWCGFSIHIQIAGVLSSSDLTLRYYLPCRAAHALLAPLILRAAANALTINSSTLPTASHPLWLSAPGALLAPAVLLLLALILLAHGKCLALTLLHRR